MQDEKSKKPYLIEWLEDHKEDRGVMAALRHGLGQPPGSVVEMYPYIIPKLPHAVPKSTENAYFLIASLFALHPSFTDTGNFGDHFHQICKKSPEHADAVERRFKALLASHPDDLPDYLRQAVSFLKSKDEPINWSQLFKDVLDWGSPIHKVQRNWADSFWGDIELPENSTNEKG